MEPYEVYLNLDLVEAVPKSGEQRRKIMEFIRALRAEPAMPGDYTDMDASLRRREIKIVGRYAITYWLDDPVKAVMVVDIRPADE